MLLQSLISLQIKNIKACVLFKEQVWVFNIKIAAIDPCKCISTLLQRPIVSNLLNKSLSWTYANKSLTYSRDFWKESDCHRNHVANFEGCDCQSHRPAVLLIRLVPLWFSSKKTLYVNILYVEF